MTELWTEYSNRGRVIIMQQFQVKGANKVLGSLFSGTFSVQ